MPFKAVNVIPDQFLGCICSQCIRFLFTACRGVFAARLIVGTLCVYFDYFYLISPLFGLCEEQWNRDLPKDLMEEVSMQCY